MTTTKIFYIQNSRSTFEKKDNEDKNSVKYNLSQIVNLFQ